MNRIKHIFVPNLWRLVSNKRLCATSACTDGQESSKVNLIATEVKCSLQPPSVVVIGAGIAGLSAAVRLLKAGFNDVIVLEATDRPGGRIHSCFLGNTVAEIGAQWITGCSLSNSIVPLASQAGLLDSPNEYDFSGGTYILSDGRPLDPVLGSHAYLVFQQLVKQAYSLRGASSTQNYGSIMNFFTVRIEQELKNFPTNQRKDARCVMYGLTNKISNRWGVELSSLSANLFGSYVPLIGKTLGLPLGFVNILSPLLKEIPNDAIKYLKIVEKIQWKGSKRARIVVNTTDYCAFHADYVIVTVSLGVLKNLSKQIFLPTLPADKRKAIDLTGFGNINKIFLEYSAPFWIPNQGPIKFAWTPEEVIKQDSWLKGLDSLEEIPGSNKILMGTISSKHADKVEELKDSEIAENITDLLRCFTKDPTIPYPASVLRSKWKTSPFFFGATSCMNINSRPDIQDDLMRPVPNLEYRDGCIETIPKLFFAGEATCKHYFSTVHGARLSGLKAADDIINLTNEIGGPPSKDEDDDDDICD